MILAFKYKLKGKNLKNRMSPFVRAVNFVWNYCVDTQKKGQLLWKSGSKTRWPTHFDLTALTKGVSKDLGIRGQTIQCVCKAFVTGRDTNRKCPRYRVSFGGKRRSLGWVPFQAQSRTINGDSITYKGKTFKWFGGARRPLPDKGVKGGHFVEDSSGNWYVVFEVEVKEDNSHGTGKTGIDLGLKHLATCSDGTKYEAPQYYRKIEEKLKIAQKSNNKKRVRAIHAKIKNQRQDFLHKLSTKLVKENELIVVGNINSSKMSKTYLAKSVYDAGWYIFKTMLRYKVSRHGARLIEVNEAYTTQTCSSCGQRPPERPKGIAGLGIREWVCSSCGTSHDRDINAAKNILALGLGTQPLAEGSCFR